MKTRADSAWTYLIANALVLPGLGSFMGGHRVAGVLQVLLATVGFALTVVWLWSWVSLYLQSGLPEGLGPRGREGLLGIGLFTASWLWSVASGLALARGPHSGGSR